MKINSFALLFIVYCIFSVAYSTPVYVEPSDGGEMIEQRHSVLHTKQSKVHGQEVGSVSPHFSPHQHSHSRHGSVGTSHRQGDVTKEMFLELMGMSEEGLSLTSQTATLHSQRAIELRVVSKFLAPILSFVQENMLLEIIRRSEVQIIPTTKIPKVESKLGGQVRKQGKFDMLKEKFSSCILRSVDIFRSLNNFGESDNELDEMLKYLKDAIKLITEGDTETFLKASHSISWS